VAVVAAPTLASAQQPTPEIPQTQPAPAIDENKIKDLVDREVARILTERAAKEAAEKAQKEAAVKETAAASAPR
jgi:hypothetical protein